MRLFTDSDYERIEAAVRALEQRSATELVVAVVRQSGDYWLGRVLVAIVWSLSAAALFIELRPELHPLWAVLVELPVGLGTYALFSLDTLERLLVPKRLAREAVERRAFELFAQRGLHKTRERTGMLLLISELEHRVVILGDSGIHERVGSAGWQAHVDHIIAAIQRGEASQGVLEVIERLGALHAEHVPARGGDRNELSDDVVRD